MSNGIVDGTDSDDFIDSRYADVDGETVNNTREIGGIEEPSVVRAGDGNDIISNTATWSVGGIGYIYAEAGDDTFQIDATDNKAFFWGGEGSDEIALKGLNDVNAGFRPITASVKDFDLNEDVISIAGQVITPEDVANGFERFAGTVEIQGTDHTVIVFRADPDEEYPSAEYRYEERVELRDVSRDAFLEAYTVTPVVDGTEGDDFISLAYTDEQGDSVSDDGNADVVLAGAGDDTIGLYRGNDTAHGGDGDDTIYGMKGNNVLHGDAGNDTLYSGRNTSELFGGDGEDVLVADLSKGADHELTGGADADRFRLDDAVDGKTSNIVIHDFVAGEDVLEIDGVVVDLEDLPEGMSLEQDEDGNAVLSFSDNETVTLKGVPLDSFRTANGIVDGTSGDDVINSWEFTDADGESLDQTTDLTDVQAGGGNDTITLNTDLMRDYLHYSVDGGEGDDVIIAVGQNTLAELIGGAGNDKLQAVSGWFDGRIDMYGGAGEDDFSISTFSYDWVKLGASRPVYVKDFNAAEDRLIIDGNVITPESVNDTSLRLTENADGFTLTVYSATPYSSSELWGETGSVVVTGSTWDEFVAGSSDGKVDGTEDDDFISLAYADEQGDSVSDDGNADVVLAGAGNDTVGLYRGNDTAHGGDGDDTIYGMKGNNVLYGDAGNDFIHSGRNTSELFGGDGEDVLVADLSKGADHELTGGADADTFRLDDAVDDKTSNVVIHDFVAGEDVLEIDGVVVDLEDLPEGMSLAQDEAGNAVLSFSDDETVTLMGGPEGLDLGDGIILPFVPLDESSDPEASEDEMVSLDFLV